MYLPSLRCISWAICPKTFVNCLAYRRNVWNAAGHDQKSIKSGEYHDECIHQVWDRSPGLFVRKCVETTKVWWMDRQMYEHLNKWMKKPISRACPPPPSSLLPFSKTQKLVARSICISPSRWRIWRQVYLPSPAQIMVRYPIITKLLLKKCWPPNGADIMTACLKLLNCMSSTMWPEQNGWFFSDDIFKRV